MKISASIYSDPSHALDVTISELEHHHIDMLHVDCLDDPNVFADIKRMRTLTSLPVDLHLISKNPSLFEAQLSSSPVDFLTVQYENLNGTGKLPTVGFKKLGLALTSATDLNAFEKYADKCDFVLLMATEPGMSGGIFNKETFSRIREFKRRYPNKRIHVDGGVNAEVSFILRNLGVHCAVSGSYLFNQKSVGSAVLGLKNAETDSHYRIKDFMRSRSETPAVTITELNLKSVLQSIEDSNMAFTAIVGSNSRLLGIISNADVRKGLLRHIDDLSSMNAASLINEEPITVNEELTVTELFRFVRQQPIPINFLPVTNTKQELVGSLTFNDLIKGES